MAVCSSCESEVSESSNFCTSCGQPMAKPGLAAAPPPAERTCPSCGATAEPSSAFCTGCGGRLPATVEPVAAPTLVAVPAPAADSSPQESLRPDAPAPAPVAAGPVLPPAFCTFCGTSLEQDTRFCTGCGANVSGGEPSEAPAAGPEEIPVQAASAPAVTTEPVTHTVPTNQEGQTWQAGSPSIAQAAAAPAPVQPAFQPAPPQGAYPPSQGPGGGKFGTVILILLVVIVAGALGGWYFWGVETIVVCSPPDVRVFLDDQEITATSYGRYVIPHLSRKPHLLRVQSPGFADIIQRLDFPLTTSREWVNIRLVPSRPSRR
jgi:double zinc ribbon protein/zinc ribbon protein